MILLPFGKIALKHFPNPNECLDAPNPKPLEALKVT